MHHDSVWVVAGDSLQLEAAVRDVKGIELPATSVIWTPLAPEIAAVGPGGRIIALADGATLVIATAGRFADTTHVTVAPAAIAGGAPVVGRTLYTGERCGWKMFPNAQRLVVDILFGAMIPPNARDAWVADHGGFVFYRFNVPAVRASLPRDSIPALVDQQHVSSVREVPDPARYDVRVIVGYDREVTDADEAQLEALGAVVRHRYEHVLQGFGVDMPDAAVPHLSSLRGVDLIEQDHTFCAI